MGVGAVCSDVVGVLVLVTLPAQVAQGGAALLFGGVLIGEFQCRYKWQPLDVKMLSKKLAQKQSEHIKTNFPTSAHTLLIDTTPPLCCIHRHPLALP
ncbi:hypothetical protein BJ741DRAFT_314000 [Chytriomyces cf. hyalinus JEL632]|nr:hypothetical protein BJ741DRAFT_314000 [Chytriomyces cf. hyalinus JEL632]